MQVLNLPHLEVLKISIAEEWSFPLLNYIAEYDHRILPHLEYLHVLGLPAWQAKYGSASLVRLEPVKAILRLPHLAEILLDHCIACGVDETFVVDARSMTHWRCGHTKCQIGRLVSTSTQLEDYRLEYLVQQWQTAQRFVSAGQ